jgi:hypothetical protein
MDLFKFYSSVMPKYKQYISDGKGRDTYITINNGGSIKLVPKADIFERNSNSPKKTYSPPAPRKEPTAVYYHSDGSGRDYYITCNNGGLTKTVEYGGKKDLFKLSLRNSSPEFSGFTHRMNKWTDPRYRSLSNTSGNLASLRLYPTS